MKPISLRDITEATHLTRSGRLSEAMTLIQSVLRGGRPSGPESDGTADAAIALQPLKLTAVDAVMAAVDKATAATAASPAVPEILGRLGTGFPVLRGLPRRGTPAFVDVAPAAGNYIAGSFTSGAGTRAYKLYVPSGGIDGPRPLIVMLHGCTQSADDFAAGTRMNFAAEEHGCFVVYPEQPLAANSQRCWNWFKPGDQQRDLGEPALIAGITRQVMKNYNIDAQRIYIAGLSAGGAAAAVMGEAYPDLYAAVGVHSGLACGAARDLPSAFAAMSGNGPVRVVGARVANRVVQPGDAVPTIVFHGDRDTTVHPRNGAEVIARAGGEVQTELEAQPTRGRFTRSIRRDSTGRSILELWEIHGAGHAWSGGSAAGSFTDPSGPDATREMLRFFLAHARQSA
jgi:poly(hydroxyalkanoate) depolymerase family esterase